MLTKENESKLKYGIWKEGKKLRWIPDEELEDIK